LAAAAAAASGECSHHHPHLAAASGFIAGGLLFEHDFAISAISTVNASPSSTRRDQANDDVSRV